MVVDVVKRPREGKEMFLFCKVEFVSIITGTLRVYSVYSKCLCVQDGFAGIYSSSLSPLCWSADSQRILVSSPQGSRKVTTLDTDDR